MSERAALSVILATDTFLTIEPVVRRLRAQTVAHKLEVVIVTPRPDELRREMADRSELAAVAIVPVDGLIPLGRALATGVRAATAPVVFIGETHTYAHEGWAEALIDAHTGDWAAVVPGFGNANPTSALSWAGFLIDYGAWLSLLPPRELSMVPAYNTAYKRAALLELGRRLDDLLTPSDELMVEFQSAGLRFVFHPSARIDHLNVSRPTAWLLERYLCGLLTANGRMARWSRRRRLLYAAGSPLIPAVVLARVAGGVTAARRGYDLPTAVFPALLLSAVVSAVGELVGYLGGPVAWGERRMTEYEIHRLRYLQA